MSRTVLCVDDLPEVLAALGDTIVSLGLEAECIASPLAALEWLEHNEPAVILADLRMADIDGLEFQRRVQKRHPNSQRVLLTVYADVEEARQGLSEGYVDYLVIKPWKEKRLASVLRAAVGRFAMLTGTAGQAPTPELVTPDKSHVTGELEVIVHRRTAQIERAKREWEQTFDAITDPLTLVDSGFMLQRANLATALLAERDIREMPGRKCHRILFGREEPCETCPIADTSHRVRRGSNVEAEVAYPEKDRVFRMAVFMPDSGPLKDKFICYYKDITQEKRLVRQVLQSEKMAGIGQLAGGVAHELNNPIGVILSFVQLSKADVHAVGDEDLIDSMEEIEKAALRCKRIVSSLLDFSRPSSDEDMALLNLNDLLENAMFLVSTHSATKSLGITKEFHPELPYVVANENQLLQVFVNLIQNAAQAMRNGGTLTLKTEPCGPVRVRASVADTGVGIKKEDLQRIFEPFYTTKAPGEGTGLGLSVSYGIVERHRGTIEAESEPGLGTTFTVTLPTERPDEDE